MPVLVLLNGPTASGKSTIAARLVEARPSALNIDIDVVRSSLAGWRDDPISAGLTARRRAIETARDHLQASGDVVIPQFLGRVDFLEQLDELAGELDVPFVELMLTLDRSSATAAFVDRSENPVDQTHRDAAFLVAQSSADDPVGDMFEATLRIIELRPRTRTVPVNRGNVDQTVAAVVAELDPYWSS